MTVLSYAVNGFFLDFPEDSILLEGLLIGLCLVLLSVVGYYFFVFSIRHDHSGKRIEGYSTPWEDLSGTKEAEASANPRSKKKVVLWVLIAVLAVSIFFLLAILLKWI